jgi:hypothetical protein
VLHQPENTQFIAVRSLDRARTFRVWTHRGSAVAVHDYKANSVEAAIEQARAEREMAEAVLSSIDYCGRRRPFYLSRFVSGRTVALHRRLPQ